MGNCLYLEVLIRLSSYRICRLVDQLRPSMAIHLLLSLCQFLWIAPGLLRILGLYNLFVGHTERGLPLHHSATDICIMCWFLSPQSPAHLLYFWWLLEPNNSNTVSRYLQSGPFPTFSSHLLLSPVDFHQLLETPVGASFISLFVTSWTCII